MDQTENLEPATILKANRGQRSERGFTLIEVLIVLAIIAMILSLGLPAVQRITYQRLSSTTRQFIGVIRSIKNDSILLGGIYRLAFDLDRQLWWVEQQNRPGQLLPSGVPQPDPKSKKSGNNPTTFGPDSAFVPAEKYSKKPSRFPDGVALVAVLTEGLGLSKEGVVYIHFFPNGYSERAAIMLARSTKKANFDGYSIVVPSISNQIEIRPRFVERFD